jgi:hypothetical protein
LDYLRRPDSLFGVPSLEKLQGLVSSAYTDALGDIPAQLLPDLMKAMWADAEQGQLSLNGSSISGQKISYIELRLQNQYRVLYFTEGATHIQQWIKQHRHSPSLLLQQETLEKLVDSTLSVYCVDYNLKLKAAQLEGFLELLWQDCKDGFVFGPGKWSSGVLLELESTQGYLSIFLNAQSQSVQWLQNQLN